MQVFSANALDRDPPHAPLPGGSRVPRSSWAPTRIVFLCQQGVNPPVRWCWPSAIPARGPIMVCMSDVATQPIAVTEQAAHKAIALSQREGYSEPILRLRVLAGGCSGFSYKLSFEGDQLPDDHVIDAV